MKPLWRIVAEQQRRYRSAVFQSTVAKLWEDFGWPPSVIDREAEAGELVKIRHARLYRWSCFTVKRIRLN
jgi:hypothetical protein